MVNGWCGERDDEDDLWWASKMKGSNYDFVFFRERAFSVQRDERVLMMRE